MMPVLDTLSTGERVLILAALADMWIELLPVSPQHAAVCHDLIERIIGSRTIVLNLPEGMR